MGIFSWFANWISPRSVEAVDRDIKKLSNQIEFVLKPRLDAKIAHNAELNRMLGLPLNELLRLIRSKSTMKAISEKAKKQGEFEINRILDQIVEVTNDIEELKAEKGRLTAKQQLVEKAA